jgi:membrane protease subunit (stomatin/prohibitin family)
MIETKTQMGVLGNMNQYAQFQTAQAIRDAAQNEGGGLAGAGVGLGAGAAMGNMMAGMMQQTSSGNAAPNVKCSKCGAEVAQGSKFCPECGGTMAPAAVKCSKCGAQINQGSKFCPECGAKQGESVCSGCGAKLVPGAKFCPECGQKA